MHHVRSAPVRRPFCEACAVASNLKRLIACFLLGALLGTLLDGIHVYGDVLSYLSPAFGDWAWFVPLEFGLVGLLTGAILPLVEAHLGRGRTPLLSIWGRLVELVLFVALYFCTVLVDGEHAWPAILALALTLLVLARLALQRVPGDWFYALVAAIAGPLGEWLISGAGLFDYAHPDFLHAPVWLPALWANGGLMIRRMLAPVVLPPSVTESASEGIHEHD